MTISLFSFDKLQVISKVHINREVSGLSVIVVSISVLSRYIHYCDKMIATQTLCGYNVKSTPPP